ncbi:RusA-like resolvase [Gordonia phage Moosehead]|nr:RusA-like resolvase [Gordonia phage Moosehead]
MTTHIITLPWTKPPLSMNDRGHWRKKAAQTASVRGDCLALARHARLPRNCGHVHIRLHYRPRDNRHRDPINLAATQKALVDGLRDYGLVPDDDPRYVTDHMPTIHPAEKGQGGRLWLELTIQETP